MDLGPPGLVGTDATSWRERCARCCSRCLDTARGIISLTASELAMACLGVTFHLLRYARTTADAVQARSLTMDYVRLTGSQEAVPHVRDALVWMLLRVSGGDRSAFERVLLSNFADLTVRSQLHMSAVRCLASEGLDVWRSRRHHRSGRRAE